MENVFGSFCRKMENVFGSFCRKMENVFGFFRVIMPGITISNKLDCSALNLQYLYIRRAAFRHNNFKQA